jgi:hypothetical protein
MVSQISTPSAASAISKLSVAEHIANIKPPPMTKSLIFLATAPFYRDFVKPSLVANASASFFLFNVPRRIFYKLHKIYRIALKIFMMQVQPIIKQLIT